MTIKTASGGAVLKPDELPIHHRGGGAHTTPLVTSETGAARFITGYTAFDPSAKIPFHKHNCEESVVLIEGDAMLDIDDREYRMKPLDASFIPADVPHRFRNLSDTQPMKILWIYARVDATRTIMDTGVTAPVSAEHKK